MASLVPGYEYDIFVSYRQKDNKYDGWVTDFVTNLIRELEATFKEEVSVYFDANPHDGLLETDNVDKSLEGKLKALILITIVSQTYCDPKSFAWSQEFIPFTKFARVDKFGMDVKLRNGNFSSRVLPVRIHDLNPEDKALLEKELNGPLRPIDFIYKASGVNRPLRSNEDNPATNQTKVFYRDQINKVANTVKDIINGMISHEGTPVTQEKSAMTPTRSLDRAPSKRIRNLALMVGFMLIVVVCYFGYARFQRTQKVKAMRNGAIAILPFENQTGKPELNSVGQVAADFISTHLLQHQFWKVVPTQEVFRQTVYSGVVTNAEAGRKLIDKGTVDYLVVGHYNLINDSILLVVSVNDVLKDNVLYTTPVIKCSAADPMKAVIEGQQLVLGYLMFSTAEERESLRPPKYDAYLEYLKGMELWTKNSVGPGNTILRADAGMENHFERAISLDNEFLAPYLKLAALYNFDRKGDALDSILQVLEPKQSAFSTEEQLRFDILKFTFNRDWRSLEELLLSKVDVSSKELKPYYELGLIALLKQNKPKKALEYLSKCDLKEFDFVNKPADQFYYVLQTHALLRLKRFNDVITLTDEMPYKKIYPLLAKRFLALYLIGRKEQMNEEIATTLKGTKPSTDVGAQSMTIFRSAQLRGDSATMVGQFQRYRDYLASWGVEAELAPFPRFILNIMKFRLNIDLAEAENVLKQELPRLPRQRRIHQLALLYAATGRAEKAQEVIKDLLAHERKSDNGITRYYVAKVEAQLGKKEQSLDYLRQSLDKGMEYSDEIFEYDADLKNIIDYPPFVELITPKE